MVPIKFKGVRDFKIIKQSPCGMQFAEVFLEYNIHKDKDPLKLFREGPLFPWRCLYSGEVFKYNEAIRDYIVAEKARDILVGL